MADPSDLPIALRRTRRSVTRLSARCATGAADVSVLGRDQTPTTPTRSLSRHSGGTKKQVRFSDPGPVLSADGDAADSVVVAGTGLTPMIRRTSLASKSATPSSTSRRRHSTPDRLNWPSSPASRGRGVNMDAPSSPFSGDVTFLPLRQVLDGRVKRRLRRNGLSEEMNTIHAERRLQAAAARAELQQLRSDVAEKDAAIQQLQQQQQKLQQQRTEGEADTSGNAAADASDDDTIVLDTDRIMDLERQVAELRRELVVRADALSPSTPEAGHRSYNWTFAARDPFSSTIRDEDSGFPDMSSPTIEDGEDVVFGDITMAELQSSTPSRPARAGGRLTRPSCTAATGSFPTPPPTSPAPAAATPVTPIGRYFAADTMLSASPVTSMLVSPPQADAEMQVSLPDAEKERLRADLVSLQGEMAQLETAVAAHQSLMARLNTTLATGGISDGADRLEEHVTGLLRSLSDKTAALAELSAELHGLGFTDGRTVCADPSGVITLLAAAFRSARLELEYLTPGEISLPLTATGAAVLDLLLERLRTLARRVHAADAQMDEHHELERSLRQQLGDRVSAMDSLSHKVAVRDAQIGELEAAVQSKDADAVATAAAHDERVAELEVGLDRLKGAMANYARDVTELEALVRRLEATVGEKEAALGEKEAAVDALEARLAAAISEGETLRADAAAEHDRTTASLRGEIDQVNAALRAAQDAARQLRLDNADLSAQLGANHIRSRTAVATLQAELTRMVSRLGEELLAGGPAETPPVAVYTGPFAESTKRASCGDSEDARADGRSSPMAEETTSRKRRRYDEEVHG
ncbi:hypothetical protein CMQ_5398 [Grosmannia clavigera kw1407]|uniref:Uncharacterized protein n=1 Tax=Grosmannia clavigera (strain kw1407 / UAMH 11150) TaxID=655863 RepID=F0XG28_GROCL|nr:uncharacterized protein CMQ_5398 [Grosmannia clavigera kw1407]EFX03348.1 hypothetical protein CMQ_5398 [Grosmannia clavigera kw1407]